MTKKELREQLLAQITPEEWEHLRAGDNCLRVSDFNRRTVMRLEEEVQGDSDAPVDSDSAAELANALQAYLGQYMAESPEAHKWIILACLFSAFIAGEPLHPVEVVHAVQRVENGETYWYCTAREDIPGSLCRWCVCRKAEN